MVLSHSKLKAKAVEKGIKQKEIASVLGISMTAYNKKLNGKTRFNIGEIQKLCEYLEIPSEQISDYFFAT